ncbi:MAG: molybdopterin-guanine dinucleotide biosynthesis protein MobB [Anaerolineae bacterium]
MPQVFGIVGYKDSGKTTLAYALARELTGRGYEVAVIRHSSHRLDLPEKDTALLSEVAGQVGFISLHEAAILWKKPLSLEGIIPYLEAEFILVEGFKAEKTFPKIVCLRGEPDDEDLLDGLAICADRVFISFVLHGFVQEDRLRIVGNAYQALRPGGRFLILDYDEFDPERAFWPVGVAFQRLECPLATDFVRRDWRAVLREQGFGDFRAHNYYFGLCAAAGGRKAAGGLKDGYQDRWSEGSGEADRGIEEPMASPFGAAGDASAV